MDCFSPCNFQRCQGLLGASGLLPFVRAVLCCCLLLWAAPPTIVAASHTGVFYDWKSDSMPVDTIGTPTDSIPYAAHPANVAGKDASGKPSNAKLRELLYLFLFALVIFVVTPLLLVWLYYVGNILIVPLMVLCWGIGNYFLGRVVRKAYTPGRDLSPAGRRMERRKLFTTIGWTFAVSAMVVLLFLIAGMVRNALAE